jgi:hypothetical protein
MTTVVLIASVIWKVILFLSFPLIVLFAHQGYHSAYRKITGYEYQKTGELVRRQIIWRLIFWLCVVTLGVVWLKALDSRLMGFIVSILEALGFTPPP